MSKKNQSFKQFFISYILIMIIPFSIGLIIYNNATNLIEEKSIEQYSDLFSKNVEIIESYFDEIHAIGQQINLDNRINRLLNINQTQTNSNYIYFEATNNISNYTLTNSLVSQYFVILKNHNRVITPNSALTFDVFKTLYSFSNLTFDEIVNNYHYNNLIGIESFNKKDVSKDVFLYLQTLPIGNTQSKTGTLIITIKRDQLRKRVLPLTISNTDTFYILDKNNNLLFSTNEIYESSPINSCIQSKTYQLQTTNNLLTYVHKTTAGLTYVAKIPKNVISSSFYSLRVLLIYSTVLLVIFSFIISYLLAKYNTKPINAILSSIEKINTLDNPNSNLNNEYELIDYTINKLHTSNKSLKTTLSNQTPIIRNNFYKQLLEGYFKKEEDYDYYLPYLSISPQKNYFVEVFDIKNIDKINLSSHLEEFNVIKAIIKEQFDQSEYVIIYIYEINASSFSIIFSSKEFTNSWLTKFDKFQFDLSKKISTAFNSKLLIGRSNTTDCLIEINKLYTQAKIAIEQAIFLQSDTIISYKELKSDKYQFYFPIDIEIELIGLIKSGDLSLLEEKLKKLFNENFINRRLNEERSSQFTTLLKGSIIRTFSNISIKQDLKEAIEKLSKSESYDSIYTNILNLKKIYCQNIKNKQNESLIDLKKRIINLIESHYCDPNFSIMTLSEKTNYSKAFLYSFFKNNFSDSFYSQLENYRINQSCELIKAKSLTIKEIAHKVGYTNDTSFRRAFKKIMHVSPSSYQNALKD